MEVLKKRRGTVKGQISRLEDYVRGLSSDLSTVCLEDINVRLDKLEQYAASFENLQIDIEMLVEGKDLEAEEEQRNEFECRYFGLKGTLRSIAGKLRTQHSQGPRTTTDNEQIETSLRVLMEHQANLSSILERLPLNSTTTAQSSDANVSSGSTRSSFLDIKLPHINIPSFDGSYEQWIPFRDLFTSMIHLNEQLRPVQKLQYLKMALKGNAASFIRHTAITDANYEGTWTELNARYNKKRLIIESHIKSIMEQPIIGQTSLSKLKRLYSITTEALQALKALEIQTDQWSYWLIYVIRGKLDAESRQLWARHSASKEELTFSDLSKFIEERIYEMESLQGSSKVGVASTERGKAVHSVTVHVCPMCSKGHELFACCEFKGLDIEAKKKFVRERNLCFNCLRGSHAVKKCEARGCRICQRRHNTLLHAECIGVKEGEKSNVNVDAFARTPSFGRSNDQIITSNVATYRRMQVFLPTALVLIMDSAQKPQLARALLDSGSQVTLITEACIQRLGLQRRQGRVSIIGLGSAASKQTRGVVDIVIRSRTHIKSIRSTAYVLNRVTADLPQVSVSESYPHLMNLDLADPSFNCSGPIDILIGCDIFFDCLQEGKITGGPNMPCALNTIFGWIISGKSEKMESTNESSYHITVNTEDTNRLLQRFWELEEFPEPSSNIIPDPAEVHYEKTIRRREDGRYIVRLPFREDVEFGGSAQIAMRRLQSMERKFDRDKNFEQQYKAFLTEYQDLGHMQEICDIANHQPRDGVFLPHHAVSKPDSTTTKLRVVFDASSKTSAGYSLNDKLLVGPVIQPDLITLLMKFRHFPVALSADVAKMYRQIWVDERDTKYQQILWRFSEEEAIKLYRLKTLTYGMAPASFQATRTLKQLALDDGRKYPTAAELLVNSFYMDDFIGGADDLAEARKIMAELTALLKGGGFDLRKWVSNFEELTSDLPATQREISIPFSEASAYTVKALGLMWCPVGDYFTFKVNLTSDPNITKRKMASEIARIFDPLGVLGPVIIVAKMYLQRLWLNGSEWDALVDEVIMKSWSQFKKQLPLIEKLQVPRYIGKQTHMMQLLGYADASEKAYAAVVYLRAKQEGGGVEVNIVASKSKVAPLKNISLPKLELCAAHLLAKLMAKIKETLHLDASNSYCFTDSTIVLSWLSQPPRHWKTFVANRTSDIMKLLPGVEWGHVRSAHNPADHASRGMDPQDLINCELWWHGPNGLLDVDFKFERHSRQLQEIPEQRNITLTAAVIEEGNSFMRNYSTLGRLKRVTAYVFRYIRNSKSSAHQRSVGPLTSAELKHALHWIVRQSQKDSFSKELGSLGLRNLPVKSKLAPLDCFVDENGLLRVGGRIQASHLEYSSKHPIILEGASWLAQLIVREAHIKYLYCGIQLLCSVIQQRYHIIGLRGLAKRAIRKCVTCIRHRGATVKQQMGNLPSCRVQPGRPFLNSGVDYAGPIHTRPYKGRGARTVKSYIALFVCLATKAVHLELVTELSTEAFIAALKRFTSRRGMCSNLYSDNATNFVGARRVLNELQQFINNKDHQEGVLNFSAESGITWHFIPPSAPNFGGLWEAGIKSVKAHLKRVVGNAMLTTEELQTMLCQIEACLNSRPLCPRSNDAADIEALTPAHFLVGGPLSSVPEWDCIEIPINRLSRWQLVQRIHQSFWKRWAAEYLSTLQARTKWRNSSDDLAVDDLVIIKEDNTPPCIWALGRVIQTHPGKDGHTRVVTLRTRSGIIKRPISKLVLLLKN